MRIRNWITRPRSSRPKQPRQRCLAPPEPLEPRVLLAAFDVSPPPILQWFESSHETIMDRAPDLFMSGYGAAWLPPPGRADTSDWSVGYDVYDRFELGSWDRHTLYGTETGLKTVASTLHRAGTDLHVDFVMNHNGYSGTSSHEDREAFKAAGGYPGFFLEFFNDLDGDFNSAYDYGDVQGRLAGLIDIDHSKDYPAVRNPVPGFANNVQAGTTPWAGRLANLPDENNRRFYPDVGHNTIYVYDPVTGEQDIPVHQFNLEDPLAGDPSEENAMGYLMRNAQWLVQAIGVDGLRIDAAKHVEGFVLDYIDRSVYRQNPRNLLDGSPKHVFTYSEVYDGDPATLHPHVKKTIDPNDPGKIGGNRDTLDFKLYFALKENLESTSTPNAWQTIKNAALDASPSGGQGDTLHNGSHGVMFVNNHDVYRPNALYKVANAYTLMHPGNTAVYYNGGEFDGHREQDIWQRFPKISHLEQEADPLRVAGEGSDIVRLVNTRLTHGRGDYAERWDGTDGLFAFERVSSALVLLSNRGDAGYDSRTLTNVGFAPGTYLVELTGNAQSDRINPDRGGWRDIPEVVQVFEEDGVSKVNVRFQRPSTIHTDGYFDFHGNGYLIYGLPTPEAPAGLELLNTDGILPGTANGDGTQRQTDLHVVKDDTLDVRLQTVEVNLLGSIHEVWADGDHALLKLDGGRPINLDGGVDFVTPGEASYGFEQFGNKASPLIGPQGLGGPRGDGEFLQTIDTTQLEEGVHFLEARAFRHRTDNGPAVYDSFKQVFYLDRLPPESGIHELRPVNNPGDTDVLIESLDFTADNVHLFVNLPESITDQEIYTMASQGQGRADQVDVNLFKKYEAGIGTGNNVFTLVTYEATGTSNVQRLAGQWVDGRGAGLGDINHDGQITPDDMEGFGWGFDHILFTQGREFNPAADVNGDGRVDTVDLYAMEGELVAAGASQDTLDAYYRVVLRRGNMTAQITPTPSGFVAHFARPVDASALNLSDVAAGTFGPSDVTLVGDTTGPVTGSLVSGSDALTFIATGGPLTADHYTVTLRSAANGFMDSSTGDLLDGNSDGTVGDDFTGSFTVAAEAVVVSLPDFTRGPGQPIDVPAFETGLPLTLTDNRNGGNGITSLQLEFSYDPQLLNVTEVVLGPDAPPGATLTADTGTPGQISLSISGAGPFDTGESHVATFTADVPSAATHGVSHVLDIRDVSAADHLSSAIPITGDDAIHVVALFGDATGNGNYSGLDAQRTARVGVGLDTGFDAFPHFDPIVIADVTRNGTLSGLDAQLIAQEAVGFEPRELPRAVQPQRLDVAPQSIPSRQVLRDQTSGVGDSFQLSPTPEVFLAEKSAFAPRRHVLSPSERQPPAEIPFFAFRDRLSDELDSPNDETDPSEFDAFHGPRRPDLRALDKVLADEIWLAGLD